MDRSEIENQIDRLGLLANDDLLWPVALLWPLADTQGWEEKVTALRRATRKQKAKSLHRRASQLWQRLDEYATDPAFSKGQAIAKFLASKEEGKIFYEHPYLRTDTAVGHLEKMALRAQEVNLPIDQQLPVELTCWNRAAAAEILKGTSSEQEKTLEEIRKEASGLLKQKGARMSLKFA